MMMQPAHLTLAGLLVSFTALLPQTARADHDSFEYHGTCYGFAGEQEMISALQDLEKSRFARVGAVQLIAHAREHVCTALDLACDVRAKYYLAAAHQHLDAYLRRYDVCDLNDAAGLVHKALHAEQLAHLATVGHKHGHHGIGHSVGKPVVSRHPVAAPVVGGQSRPRASLYIGGKRGGIFLNF